jgi:anti-anti-sigma factor
VSLPEGEPRVPGPRPGSERADSGGTAGPGPTAPSTPAPLAGRVGQRGVAGVPHTADQLGCGVGGERSGSGPRPGGGGEPELMDLRLHMPRPDVVIVRVSGAVDPVAAPVLAALVGKQLLRVPHVVLNLGEVTVLGPQGLTVLLMLYQEAMARGVELYVVGVERDAVRRPLHARGLAQLVRFDATVDAVVASFPLPVRSRVGSRRA